MVKKEYFQKHRDVQAADFKDFHKRPGKGAYCSKPPFECNESAKNKELTKQGNFEVLG